MREGRRGGQDKGEKEGRGRGVKGTGKGGREEGGGERKVKKKGGGGKGG